MADLLNDNTDFEVSKYYDAQEMNDAGFDPAIIKDKKSVFNPESGMNDILTSMPSGGYVKIGEEEPEVMAEAPAQPEMPGMSDAAPAQAAAEEAKRLQEIQGSYSLDDLRAAGYTDEQISAAGLDVQPEPMTEQEIAQYISEGAPLVDADPTLRDQGAQIVSTYVFDAAVAGLRDELAEQGMGPEEIERTVKAREGELFREAEVYSNALFGTGATGYEVGLGDFLTAGAMDIQEGYRMFNQQRGEGGSMAGRAMGAGIMIAGIAEATGVGYAFGKLLKRGINLLEPEIIRMGEEAQGRIDAEGATLFSNPVGPIVDRGLAAAGRVAKAEPPTETKSGIIAFHGSGADFDEFNLDMIGTGEGSQAYGYGLYFTDTKSIAEFYKDAVREESNIIHLDGKPIDSVYSADNEERFSEYITENFEPDQFNDAYMVLDNLGQGISSVEDADSMAASSLTRPQMQIYNKIRNDLEVPELPEGKMYEVMINIQPDDLLDYDKPLNSQSKEIQSAALKAAKSAGAYKGTDKKTLELSGGALLSDMVNNIVIKQNLQGMTSEAEKIAAQELFGQGIPGIKYFDNASRNTADGTSLGVTETEQGFVGRVESTVPSMFGPTDPQRVLTRSKPYKTQEEAESWIEEAIGRNTRNYVVFDDKLVNIMKKYGIVGPVAVTAMKSEEQEET